MQSYVDDLLDLRMLREGSFKPEISAFNPKTVIDFVQRIFQPQAIAKNVGFHLQICDRLSLPVTRGGTALQNADDAAGDNSDDSQ